MCTLVIVVCCCVSDMLKDSCKSSEQNSRQVALELQELKKKLRDQRKATDRAESDSKKYYESLLSIKTHLNSAMDTVRVVTTEKSSAEKTGAAAGSSPSKATAEPPQPAADAKKEAADVVIKKEVNGEWGAAAALLVVCM